MRKRVIGGAILVQALATFAALAADAAPLQRAHSHNDYEHQRPLLDALDQGFSSVEADIYLVERRLLVAHSRSQVRPERTLQALYLDPLRDRVAKNRGRVYGGGPEVSLLIDLKTDWQTTYPALREVLRAYQDILTRFEAGGRREGAVLVIVSGSRSRQMFAGETNRLAAYDGELTDLDSGLGAEVIPWISANWTRVFNWRGEGEFSAAEKERLTSIVRRAHQQGRKVRFWGAPDQPGFWKELLAADVDLINTDKLAELRAFLERQAPPAQPKP